MYSPSTNLFLSDSISESGKRRKLRINRKLLVLLDLEPGRVVKTINGPETISEIDMAFAQIKTFSGHRYGPLEIRKVG
jgi:hypothetical protein